MKKFALIFALICIAMCAFAMTVSAQICAEGEHEGAWEVRHGEGVLTEASSVEICTKCNLVLNDENLAPVIVDKGFSYFGASIVQGYRVNTETIDKYVERTGINIGYGIVAASREAIGTQPLSAGGVPVSDKVIAVDLGSKGSEHFDIKVASISDNFADMKIILCAYLAIGDEVIYVDNGVADSAVAGVSYNEVVNLLENGIEPKGLYEYRKLTNEEMDIYVGGYWHSNASQCDTLVTDKSDSVKNSATRMFTRAELPKGSHIVIKNGWQARPELWEVNENGAVKRNSSRPYGSNLSAGTYSIDDMWAKSGEFVYLAFNVSPADGFAADGMTPDGISKVFEIYVPAGTMVNRIEVEEAEDVSVKGLKLLKWDETNLFVNKYWNCTSSSKITSGNATAKIYYATKRFTSTEIPVGSVIEIRGDLMYRPEWWLSDKNASSRPGVSSAYRFVVTEDFWDTEAYRAFNICEITKGNLTAEDWDRITDSFRIYIPVE